MELVVTMFVLVLVLVVIADIFCLLFLKEIIKDYRLGKTNRSSMLSWSAVAVLHFISVTAQDMNILYRLGAFK